MQIVRTVAIAATLLACGCAPTAPATQEPETLAAEPTQTPPPLERGSVVAGGATAHDGDDLIIGDVDVRLNGFDTPEQGKRCGEVDVYERATQELASIVAGQEVSCEVVTIDRYRRPVSRCTVNGVDIGERMVSSGWARDWPQYSQRRYATAEADARAAGRGIWGLQCPANLWGTRNYD